MNHVRDSGTFLPRASVNRIAFKCNLTMLVITDVDTARAAPEPREARTAHM